MRTTIKALILALIASAPLEAADVTIATFNTEFLTKPKVHMKFGFSFFLDDADQATWNAPGFRDQQFTIAATAVAGVIASIDADIIALTEVGDPTDVAELNSLVAAAGVTYPHTAVCDCTDNTTQQHVAVLSRFPLSNVLQRSQVGRATSRSSTIQRASRTRA